MGFERAPCPGVSRLRPGCGPPQTLNWRPVSRLSRLSRVSLVYARARVETTGVGGVVWGKRVF